MGKRNRQRTRDLNLRKWPQESLREFRKRTDPRTPRPRKAKG